MRLLLWQAGMAATVTGALWLVFTRAAQSGLGRRAAGVAGLALIAVAILGVLRLGRGENGELALAVWVNLHAPVLLMLAGGPILAARLGPMPFRRTLRLLPAVMAAGALWSLAAAWALMYGARPLRAALGL